MTLDERIARQPGSHLVRVPKKQIAALKRERDKAIAERDAYMLAANAWFREERRKKRRREAEPQPRRKSIAAQMLEAQTTNPKPRV